MDGQPADEPLATITAGGSHHAEVQAFLVKYFSNGTPKPVDSPLDTVTTKDRFALVTIHGEEYIITDIKCACSSRVSCSMRRASRKIT